MAWTGPIYRVGDHWVASWAPPPYPISWIGWSGNQWVEPWRLASILPGSFPLTPPADPQPQTEPSDTWICDGCKGERSVPRETLPSECCVDKPAYRKGSEPREPKVGS